MPSCDVVHFGQVNSKVLIRSLTNCSIFQVLLVVPFWEAPVQYVYYEKESFILYEAWHVWEKRNRHHYPSYPVHDVPSNSTEMEAGSTSFMIRLSRLSKVCVCGGGKDHSKAVFRWPLKRHIFIHNGRLFAVKLNIPTFISLKTEKKKLNQAKEKKASIKCTLWIDAKKLEQHRTKDNLYKGVLMWSLNIENLCFQQEFWSKNI